MNSQLLNILQKSKTIVFFTGAGISSESGIPTFRGEEGLWKNYDPMELATPQAFRKDPELVWELYEYRRQIVRDAQPNAGHLAIAEFDKKFKTIVITQNVDNLHKRAGSKTILELHGNIEKNFCSECGERYDFAYFKESILVPDCEVCGGKIRPGVVWFGESLPADEFRKAFYYAENCDVCFVVGTSALVYPAIDIPHRAKQKGATIVEINLNETPITQIADFSFFGKAGEILPEILKSYNL